ncbi:MAG: hypothetical protein LBP25_06150 [Tannerellaceae bacterium]|jgi:hypothetical protein|nr:hypothetical protein [Tannerellaceae bacterium]
MRINTCARVLQHLRNSEHFDLMESIVTNVEAIGMRPAILLPVWNAFRQAFGREDAICRRTARKATTALVVAAHERLLGAYMALKRTVEAASYSAVPAVREAAAWLLGMMDNYTGNDGQL